MGEIEDSSLDLGVLSNIDMYLVYNCVFCKKYIRTINILSYNKRMNTIHQSDSSSKAFTSIKKTFDNLAENEDFKKLQRKFEDLSGNILIREKLKDLSGNTPLQPHTLKKDDLKHESQHYGDYENDPEEGFTSISSLAETLGINALGELLETFIMSPEFAGTIKSAITPFITMLVNTLVYNDPGVEARDAAYVPDDKLYDSYVCYDKNGKCKCADGCNLNKGLFGQLVKTLTGKEMFGDGNNMGLVDYYVKAKMMFVAILIAGIIWQILSIIKRISLFILGRPS
tara:strand:- start:39433 stop:40284 length:852 start_codon:yes stop_codon:yes gene_type:complete